MIKLNYMNRHLNQENNQFELQDMSPNNEQRANLLEIPEVKTTNPISVNISENKFIISNTIRFCLFVDHSCHCRLFLLAIKDF